MADTTNQEEIALIEADLSKLSPTELVLLKEQTGIDDEEALKKHIYQIQSEASKASFLLFINSVINTDKFNRVFRLFPTNVLRQLILLGRVASELRLYAFF